VVVGLCVWCTAGAGEVSRFELRCQSLSFVLPFMQLAMRPEDRVGPYKGSLKLLMPGRNVCHNYAIGFYTPTNFAIF
jgi:hypothetical protein